MTAAKRQPKKRATTGEEVVVEAPVEAVEETVEEVVETPTETPEAPVVEEKEEDAVAEAGEEEPEPEEPEVTVSDAARTKLSTLSTKLIKLIEKASDDEVTDADTAEQIRLGAVRLLEEVVGSLDANRLAVQELEVVLGEATKEAQKLGAAHTQLSMKSDSYRAERDAFRAINNLSEDEFHVLLASSRGKKPEEKAE
jgi:hypothetical protein